MEANLKISNEKLSLNNFKGIKFLFHRDNSCYQFINEGLIIRQWKFTILIQIYNIRKLRNLHNVLHIQYPILLNKTFKYFINTMCEN